MIVSLSNTVCYVLKEGILTFNAVINFVSASLPLVSGVWVWDLTVLVLLVVCSVWFVLWIREELLEDGWRLA